MKIRPIFDIHHIYGFFPLSIPSEIEEAVLSLNLNRYPSETPHLGRISHAGKIEPG